MEKRIMKILDSFRPSFIHKFICVSILIGGFLLIGSSLITHYEVKQSFDDLNQMTSQGDKDRLLLLLKGYEDNLNLTAYEWAEWDDTYLFVSGLNPDYFAHNLAIYPFESAHVGEFILTDRSGTVILYLNRSNYTNQVRIPEERFFLLQKYNLIGPGSPEIPTTGLVSDGNKVYIVASHQVLRTNGSGQAVGKLVLLNALNDTLLSEISSNFKGPVSFIPVEKNDTIKSPDNTKSKLPLFKIFDGNLTSIIILSDISKNPVVIASLTSPLKNPYNLNVVLTIALTVFFSFIFFGLITYLWFTKTYSRHLKLIKEELDAATAGYLTSTSHDTFPPELEPLASSASGLVQTLQQKHQSLNHAERIREAAEIRWETLFNSAEDVVLIGDNEGILTVNPRFEELTGVSKEEIVGVSISLISHIIIEVNKMSTLEQYWNDEGSVGRRFTWTIHHKNGDEVVLDVQIRFVNIEENLIRFCIGRDCTNETKMMREQERALLQIDKNMAQLAFLNDGIRNPLSLIIASAELDDGPHKNKIIQGAEMIDSIIDQLDKGFAESEKVRNFLKRTISGFSTEKNEKNLDP